MKKAGKIVVDFIVKAYLLGSGKHWGELVGSYLSLPVYTDDAWRGLMWRGDKDGLPTDTIHVDAGARLQVVQVNVSIFGNEKHNIVLGAHLPNKICK